MKKKVLKSIVTNSIAWASENGISIKAKLNFGFKPKLNISCENRKVSFSLIGKGENDLAVEIIKIFTVVFQNFVEPPEEVTEDIEEVRLC